MTPEDLDRAATGREVATLTALVLIQTSGDPGDALTLLDYLATLPSSRPQEAGELDAVSISAQAIREAMGMRSVF